MEIELLYFNHNCNSYLLINQKDCLVVDPGFNDHDALINAISKRGLTLKGVLLTHSHYDHIEGLKTIKNVPVYVYRGEEKGLTNSRFNCSFMANNEFTIDDLDVKLFDEGELEIIGIKMRVIHTPFHTSGSVCFYVPALKVVLTGDTLFLHAIGRSDLPTSEARKTSASLKKLFTLPLETVVYPGHGPKTSLEREYRFLKNEYLS